MGLRGGHRILHILNFQVGCLSSSSGDNDQTKAWNKTALMSSCSLCSSLHIFPFSSFTFPLPFLFPSSLIFSSFSCPFTFHFFASLIPSFPFFPSSPISYNCFLFLPKVYTSSFPLLLIFHLISFPIFSISPFLFALCSSLPFSFLFPSIEGVVCIWAWIHFCSSSANLHCASFQLLFACNLLIFPCQ